MEQAPTRLSWRALAAALVGVSLGAGSTSADEAGEEVWEEEPPPVYVAELRGPVRKLIGFDFGLGIYDGFCSDCLMVGALSAGFQTGLQIAPRVALIAEVWSLLHLLPADSADARGFTAHSIVTAGARVWLQPTLWIQSGLGAGAVSIVGPIDDVAIGPSATLSIGSELRHRPTSGIDLALKLGGTWYSEDGEPNDGDILYNLAAAIGYHWN
jgi:hypothetical protein